ncbi:DUF2335 domain-containing protein [Vibrio alginolyticus]|nr:DUF2335 domain-containing protein [Vibrio alginolyticus]
MPKDNKDKAPSNDNKQENQEVEQNDVQPLEVLLSESPELAEVASQDPQVGEFLQKSPKLRQALLQITHHQQHFSGPMPPPEYLAEYEKIVPGIAKELFDGVKEDSAHIRKMQRDALKAQKRDNLLGQIFGFLIGIFAIGCGTYAAVNGSPLAGGFIGGGGVAALVAVFVIGKKPNAQPPPEK